MSATTSKTANLVRRLGVWGELAGIRNGDLVEFRGHTLNVFTDPPGRPVEGTVKFRTETCVVVSCRDRRGDPATASVIPDDVRRVFFDAQGGDEDDEERF